MQQALTPALVKRLLRFDECTGKLYWRERTPDLFSDGYRTAAGNCANWNSQFAGKEAITAVDGHGYLHGPVMGSKQKAHRLIWCIARGEWPNNIDHIDGNRTNNRLENLRSVSAAENNLNLAMRRSNKSGQMGVCWDATRKRWLVTCRRRFVGRYDTFAEAVAARERAASTAGFHKNHGKRVACSK